jgi:cytochrome c oxidase cbb3-type subunit III
MTANKVFKITGLLSLLGASAFGQEKTLQESTGSTNLVPILMIVIAIVLAFVIWGLSNILLTLSKEVVKRSRQEAKVFSVVIILFCLLSNSSFAQTAPAAAAVSYGGLTSDQFWVVSSVIGLEILIILFLTFSIRGLYREFVPEKLKAVKESHRWAAIWSRIDKKFLTKAKPVEHEADILLDHNYDGIKELDNALPPWWKYGFIVSIIAAFIYLMNFHVIGSGKSPDEEYQSEMARAQQQLAEYHEKNKDNIDENNVPMADAAGIANGKATFIQTCFPCHGKLGEGGVGPNLTDDYWLHGGKLNDIYHTITNGYPDKGMQSWKSQFTPKQISEIASYIKTLRGSNPPAGKAPQGDLFVDGPQKTDSTAKKADSAAVKPLQDKKVK